MAYSNNISRVLRLITYIPTVVALPTRRNAESLFRVDPSQDAWAEALSGFGPLILLIGEKNTKQLLREVHGLFSILSISCAPLGLLSVLTSMIRLCGSQKLRSYLGYEHEPRINAALEVTKVNCGGVHAEVIDGFISRSTSSDPASRAVAAFWLEGDSEACIEDSLEQIRLCTKFQHEKATKGCPETTANVNWCFRITCAVNDAIVSKDWMRIVAQALDISDQLELRNILHDQDGAIHRNDLDKSILTQQTIEISPGGNHPPTQKVSREAQSRPSGSEDHVPEYASVKMPSSDPVVSSLPDTWRDEEKKDPALISVQENEKIDVTTSTLDFAPALKSTFFCTFDGVSELNVSEPTPEVLSIGVALTSFLSMLAIQVLCLWQEGWFSSGIIMVFAGYFCMVTGVSAASYIIFSSCSAVTMSTRTQTAAANWEHGIVMLLKNSDSLDTGGSRIMQAKHQKYVFEAVWLVRQHELRFLLTWFITIFLTLSFICYYLGLRSSRWWLSVAQLIICLLAAFARSANKMERNQFELVGDIRVDRNCLSTGILTTQRASRIPREQWSSDTLDLRIYALRSSCCLPLTGELVAWQIAKMCETPKYAEVGNRVLATTGMRLSIFPGTNPLQQRKIVLQYKGGVVTTEGLAFPNATLLLAFESLTKDLAAPTPLLARAIMRQPEWSVEQNNINKDSLPRLGGTYITTLDSLITWWTVSEDRNDMGDQHKNLHGSFVLICVAFFLAILRGYDTDDNLLSEIEAAHRGSTDELARCAEEWVQFLLVRS